MADSNVDNPSGFTSPPTNTPPKAETKPDVSLYETWDKLSLIARLQELERRLSLTQTALTNAISGKGFTTPRPSSSTATTTAAAAAAVTSPSTEKPERSKLTLVRAPGTRLIALKLAYLGANYSGFEHHANNSPPLPTVEACLFKALLKSRLVPSKDGGIGVESWPGDEVAEYSKCGRTDRGVSSFGQVVGVRVRSKRPENWKEGGEGETGWDESKEMPYVSMLNRLLPSDIRVLAWCPNPPEGFSARFNCRMRQYKYFFTNPFLPPIPNGEPVWLDIPRMQTAAKLYEGDHDFRNFSKLDPSKQLENFTRRIFLSQVEEVDPGMPSFMGVSLPLPNPGTETKESRQRPRLYVFNLHGTAFLWHQVRHMIALLFLIGQGLESPSLITTLFDISSNPTKPLYEMASDRPLVLWDCVFGEEELKWVYPSKEEMRVTGKRDKGVVDELWANWAHRKMEETLAGKLAERVWADIYTAPSEGITNPLSAADDEELSEEAFLKKRREFPPGRNQVFVMDGTGNPRSKGRYKPVMGRERMETVEVLNQRYREKKGIPERKRAEEVEAEAVAVGKGEDHEEVE